MHEKYLRREMILGLNKLLACSLDETIDIADTLVDAHNLLDRLEGEFGHNDTMRGMDALMTDTMKEAEARMAKSVNGVTGIPTGLAGSGSYDVRMAERGTGGDGLPSLGGKDGFSVTPGT